MSSVSYLNLELCVVEEQTARKSETLYKWDLYSGESQKFFFYLTFLRSRLSLVIYFY